MSDHESNVIRGHKANLSNQTTSDESKTHSKEVLASLGADEDSHDNTSASSNKSGTNKSSGSSGSSSSDEEHNNRVLGGHKATMNNDSVSEDAKQHSKEVLEKAGAL